VLNVAVFAMGSPGAFSKHLELVCTTLASAATMTRHPLRLLAFGRGMLDSGPIMQQRLARHGVACEYHGILSNDDTSRLLHRAQAVLFVRGPISTQRTTVLAGNANGIPTVGYSGDETRGPIVDAGVVLAESDSPDALAGRLAYVLSSDEVWREHHERALSAYEEHFAWNRVAARYSELLP
jgi:glycosyltransferase involved in cell wall biosynthesis